MSCSWTGSSQETEYVDSEIGFCGSRCCQRSRLDMSLFVLKFIVAEVDIDNHGSGHCWCSAVGSQDFKPDSVKNQNQRSQ